MLHNSEHPVSVFSILDNGTKTITLVADQLFDLLMLKMTSIYTSKKQTRLEAKGPRFELGDFLVKLGTVSMGQNFKGVLVEVRLFQTSFFFTRHLTIKTGLPATGKSQGKKNQPGKVREFRCWSGIFLIFRGIRRGRFRARVAGSTDSFSL